MPTPRLRPFPTLPTLNIALILAPMVAMIVAFVVSVTSDAGHPEPIFTSTTKADSGHDETVTDAEAAALVGDEVFEQVREATLAIYRFARAHTAAQGVILADTKLEFGAVDGQLLVIDEMLTPDSSRYWPAEQYEVGTSPPSFDKQFVRDHYLALGWDRTPPARRCDL